MSEYVWCTQNLLLGDGHFNVWLTPGEPWWADDPLVAHRPEFFSSTPLMVRSTTGRAAPGWTPLLSAEEKAAAELAAKAAHVEAILAAGEEPTVVAKRVRRGQG